MPSAPATYRPQGRVDAVSSERFYDRMRASTDERRLYGRRWRKYRLMFISSNPLCVMCLAEGHTKPTEIVDHKIPHKGDEALFWDPSNHQALCKPHHDSDKQRQDRSRR